MKPVSRRQFAGLSVGALSLGLAGCTDAISDNLDNDAEGEFLVVGTYLVHSPGYRWEDASYPDDILAR